MRAIARLCVSVCVPVMLVLAPLAASQAQEVRPVPAPAAPATAAKAAPTQPAAVEAPSKATAAREPAVPPPGPASGVEPPASVAAEPAPAPTPPARPVAPPSPAPALALPDMDDVLAPVAAAAANIEALEKQHERARSLDSDLGQRRNDVDALVGATQAASDALQPRIDAARVQLEKLGAAPKDDPAAEAPQVTAERARLRATLTTLEGASKSAELVKVRARQLNARIQDDRHALFARNLFQRTVSPLQPALWQQIAADYERALRQLQAVFGTWRGIIVSKWPVALGVTGLATAAFAILWLVNRRIMARTMPAAPLRTPGYAARAAAACLAAPMYALPGIVAILILSVGYNYGDLIYSRVEQLTEDLVQSALIFVGVTALASAILEPRKPAWRLMNLSNAASRSLWRSVRAIALVYAVDLALKEIIRLLVLPLPFNMALSFITSIAFSALLLKVVLTPFTAGAAQAPSILAGDGPAAPVVRASRWSPRWLKLPLLVVAVAIMAAGCAGYVALGRFAAGQVVITGSAAVLVALLHLGIRTAERGAASPHTWLGIALARGLGFEEGQRRVIGRALSILLHAMLAIAAIPGLLLAWGFSLSDVLEGVKSAMFGFEIGHFRISLARILMALGLFAGLLFATRLLQRWLQGSVLRPERMDPGIANSIYQGIGYAGFGLAVLAGVSFAGIDITNLAIVAGALSVGIGFGLQSIVNNFVSGLILLIERPIKVGDLIVVKGGGEGYVRAISVRSTEIETFDRSSLIVPNSELISNVVTNWTHRNALGRVVIKVNASYKSDPEHVLRVLTDVAKASKLVMQQPAPLVTLDNLGADALEFSVRVLVADINRALAVQTELRTAIVHAFRAHSIEFPTAERDIFLRDLDGVKVLIARVLEERARQAPQTANARQTAAPAKPD